jgi:hypothetical protein
MKIGADIFKRLLAAFGGISGFEIDMPLLVVSQMGGSLTVMGWVTFLKRILYYSNDSSSCTEVGIEESDAGLTRLA